VNCLGEAAGSPEQSALVSNYLKQQHIDSNSQADPLVGFGGLKKSPRRTDQKQLGTMA
jgi:hypothetical protein